MALGAIPDVCRPFLPGAAPLNPNNFVSVFDIGNVAGGAWFKITILMLLLSTSMLVLFYFVSQLLRNAKLEAWVKFEFFQLVATAVIALFMFGGVYMMCTFDASIFDTARYANSGDYSGCSFSANGKTVVTPYCIAQKYLWKVRAVGQDIFQMLMTINYVFSLMFKMIWESRPLGIGYTVEPLGGFIQLQNLFLVGISAFMIAFLSVIIQMRVLDFFMLAMPFFFFPIGIVLRAFPPTREFGGSIVAIVFASLLFYPLILVFDDLALFSNLADLQTGVAVDSAFNMAMARTSGGQWSSLQQSPTGNFDYQRAGDYLDNTNGVMADFRSVPWKGGTLGIQEQHKELSYFIFWPFQVVMVYFVAAVLLPLITFIAYVEVARALSILLGSELDLTNLTRMI